ncbi:Methyltransferase domain-containing protein [Ectothiorhodosinus mongolicus]|uniref:Methyltransferase domain-containing protein n=1 Tax=Ectothiorhodosinus mongolicus TaxID=233100 RepID=A0A1R3VMX8_9GAMM|nr:class I SAM-dependent methyltransferase [Ectothiorhodosinus mongolicus]ULX56398.1 class I SAM-dependent methyltransferase [Ectothiorhodosinus mongolicus]SIT65919.1 Methyltransferase domain-containing protein [Ectothiorhodosinus mongolicus]
MAAPDKAHWETVYGTRPGESLSWYQQGGGLSLEWIQGLALPSEAGIIDVGGGMSTLIDELVAAGFTDLTVLDISEQALQQSRNRLDAAADAVEWRVEDITQAELPNDRFDLWHDRAVFHFLTEAAHREAYVQRLMRSLRPGGWVLMATFALDGPERCSGLPVVRYGPESLQETLGQGFSIIKHAAVEHMTPAGAVQNFNFCLFKSLI